MPALPAASTRFLSALLLSLSATDSLPALASRLPSFAFCHDPYQALSGSLRPLSARAFQLDLSLHLSPNPSSPVVHTLGFALFHDARGVLLSASPHSYANSLTGIATCPVASPDPLLWPFAVDWLADLAHLRYLDAADCHHFASAPTLLSA